MGTNSTMVRNLRMMLSTKTVRISPRDAPRWNQKNNRRPQRDRWETLVGWGTPPIYDELGIDVWVKKRKQRDNPPVKPTGRRVAPRQPWEDYACELDNFCEAITDHDTFVHDSLPREKPKPVPPPDDTPVKPISTVVDTAKPEAVSADGVPAAAGSGKGRSEATGSQGDAQVNAIQDEASIQELQGRDAVGTETEGADNTDRTLPVPVGSGREHVPLSVRELDVGAVSSYHADHGALPPELASRFMLRERIVREAAAGLLPGGAPNGCSSARATTGVEGTVLSPVATPRPVRLCYSQSNITLQRPLLPLPADFPEEDEEDEDDEDEDPVEDRMSDRGTSGRRVNGSLPSRRRVRDDGLVSEWGSWSEASDPDYQSQELLDEGEQEVDAETEITEHWPQLDDRSDRVGGHKTPSFVHSRLNSARNLRLYSAGRLSSAGFSRASARRRAPSGRSGDAAATTGSGSDGDRRPVSLVLKTMVLDSLPDSQRVGPGLTPSASGTLPFDKSRAQSARSGPSHSSNPSGSTVLPPHISRSVDSKLSSIPGGGVFQGLSNYANPYKDRLPSKGIGLGDLLPAVDTSLRTTLSTRKTVPTGRREERLWLTAGGDMTVTGRETLLPYEDSLILMREGVEMLKMRENSTVLGSAGFRASVTTKTPLHRAQENVHKRLYGHLHGRGRSSMQQDEDEESLSVRVNSNKWSSMVSHYSAPPRLTPGPKTAEPSSRSSQGDASHAGGSSPPAPASSSNGANTLNSLYKLSRRRKTRERAREGEAGRPQHHLKPPPVTPRLPAKTRPTPVGPHFRELAQLRT